MDRVYRVRRQNIPTPGVPNPVERQLATRKTPGLPGAILESQRWSKEVPGSQFQGFLTNWVEGGEERDENVGSPPLPCPGPLAQAPPSPCTTNLGHQRSAPHRAPFSPKVNGVFQHPSALRARGETWRLRGAQPEV